MNIKCIPCFLFPADEPLKLKRVSMSTKAYLGKLKNKSLKGCNQACIHYQECSSYLYNEKTRLCYLSNETQLSDKLKPNDGSWDVYMTLPGQ